MNRRDTIIVAVLLNAAIIAVLLIMAVNTDDEVLYDGPPTAEVDKNIPHTSQTQKNSDANQSQIPNTMMVDFEEAGFENLSNNYPSSHDEFFFVDEDLSPLPEKTVKTQAAVKENTTPSYPEIENVKVVDIVVKKGDSLDKIARANGTTIEAIKNLNQLKSVSLSIGQKLKVPVGYKKSNTPLPKDTKTLVETKPSASSLQERRSAEFYIVKSGDTPWKIAKEQHVSMDDILRLNQLNEEKARNLKIGDKIRIR